VSEPAYPVGLDHAPALTALSTSAPTCPVDRFALELMLRDPGVYYLESRACIIHGDLTQAFRGTSLGISTAFKERVS